MNCFILSVISSIVLLGTGSCFTIKQNSTDEKSPIIGGGISDVIVPYHVSMLCNDEYFCGGALISQRHVLTAAHCIIHMIKKNCVVKVLAGSTYAHGGEYIEVESGKAHPEYSPIISEEHDIGVLKLKYPFTLSERINTVALSPYPPINSEVITITGYGRVDPTTNHLSPVLKQYSSVLLTYEECYRHIGSRVFPGDFCDYGQRDIGTCQGDSGSPVVNSHYLVGVVSRGVNVNKPKDPVIDCAVGVPNMFASVYYHLNFINEWLSR